ncbi:alkaline phosphatase family protein [Ralstonia nicotianae]
MAGLQEIKHVVVLMLENRSFDNLFGTLYPKSDSFNGLSGNETNPDGAGQPIRIWTTPTPVPPGTMTIPNPDPGELFADINQQLFGSQTPSQSGPSMQGFTINYAKNGGDPRNIMHHFAPEQVPALTTLARNYAVCDAWFASAPCQTWPNRFFVHTGTAHGYPNNSPVHFPYLMPTLFNALNGVAPNGWAIYYHDFPHALTLTHLWTHLNQFHLFDDFLDDAANGKLPSYSFIEPRYFADLGWPNDMHPPHDVGYGDALVAQVYNALSSSSEQWASTMLVVTFDEHGGCYDHVPPPNVVPPSPPQPGQLFAFDRLGVRVPTVVASPWIPKGTVFRSIVGQPYDHTSIIKTLRNLYNIRAPLTARDAGAPDLSQVLSLTAPMVDNRDPVTARQMARDPAGLKAARNAPLNDFQWALHEAAAMLAPLGTGISVDDHVRDLSTGLHPPVPAAQSAGQAAQHIRGALDSMNLPYEGQ